MENYKPNSHKSKVEATTTGRKKLDKVVTGKAIVKKRSGVSKVADAIISEDVDNVKSTVVTDVLIPALKKTISDIITTGVEMLLYGETRGTSRRTNASGVSYREYYDRGRDRYSTRASNMRYRYDDVIVRSKKEAKDVLDGMYDVIDTYQVATVGDLLDLADLPTQSTDFKYGWTELRNADIVNVREGYLIKLPRPLPID